VTRSFQQSYRRWRPMVEHLIAWLVADGCRRVPYRGIQRNEPWWSLRVAAVNLRRLLVLGLPATMARGAGLTSTRTSGPDYGRALPGKLPGHVHGRLLPGCQHQPPP
jgi:hypothetical protein